jgi:glycosyltransferase involved in cell wall biosynthesis
MEEFCHRKFNARGEVLYPIRDDALAPRPIEESRQLKKAGVLTLGFAGNLGYGYGEQLVRMLPALRQARARVVVFGRRPGPDCVELERATDCIDLRGFVPSKQAWDGIKQECDAVIFPYLNPAGRMQLLYSHHFPSKLAEYLALGMPVFMAGPAEATGVRWASANPSAVLLETALDCESMAASLGRLREDAPMRMAMAAAALAAGSASFDPVAIRDQMIKALRAAAVARSF